MDKDPTVDRVSYTSHGRSVLLQLRRKHLLRAFFRIAALKLDGCDWATLVAESWTLLYCVF